MELLTIFLTGFVSVFALGFQSRNVNHGNYLWAAGTSVFVGLSQTLLWKHIVIEDSLSAGVVYGCAGAMAIVSSMFIHERFIKNDKKRSRTTGQD
jgi:hypothetical protein